MESNEEKSKEYSIREHCSNLRHQVNASFGKRINQLKKLSRKIKSQMTMKMNVYKAVQAAMKSSLNFCQIIKMKWKVSASLDKNRWTKSI